MCFQLDMSFNYIVNLNNQDFKNFLKDLQHICSVPADDHMIFWHIYYPPLITIGNQTSYHRISNLEMLKKECVGKQIRIIPRVDVSAGQ